MINYRSLFALLHHPERMRAAAKEPVPMSEKHPECPLYNPLNCKEYHNPKLCAFARKDGECRKKRKSTARAVAKG